MGNFDVEMQLFVWKYVLPVSLVLVSFKVFKRQYKSLYYIVYAFILNRMGIKYNKVMSKHKEKLFKELHVMTEQLGRTLSILEIGCGSGTNFKFFPKGTNVICVDPNPHFSKYLLSNKDNYPNVNFKEFVVGKGEDMSLIPNNSVDAVVCTLVLCSVDDIDLCLSEFKRVLRQGGKFLYLEHVSAPVKTWNCRMQSLFAPLWRIVADGCRLNSKLWINVNNAGFHDVEQEQFLSELKWTPIRPHLIGTATK